MEYKAKHKAWQELHSTDYLDKDIDLLKKAIPNAEIIGKIPHLQKHAPGRLEKEILWQLLDIHTPEEILKNRGLKVDISKQLTPEEELKKKAQEILIWTDDISSIDYHSLLKLVKDLELKTENKSKDTVLKVLSDEQSKLRDKFNEEQEELLLKYICGELKPEKPFSEQLKDVEEELKNDCSEIQQKQLLYKETFLKNIISELNLNAASDTESENEELREENEELKQQVEDLEDTVVDLENEKKKDNQGGGISEDQMGKS